MVVYKEQNCITHSSKIMVPEDLITHENPLSGSEITFGSLYFHREEKGRAVWVTLTRRLIPFIRNLSSSPNYLPNATPPNGITLGAEFQHMSFRGSILQQVIIIMQKQKSMLTYKVLLIPFRISYSVIFLEYFSEGFLPSSRKNI